MTMENETKHTEFLLLVQELQCHILAFLPWRDILRLTSVCKTLHQTYMSSCELQYIVELGGQQLLPFPDIHLNNHVPISERLQLLRDKAHAWLRFDIRTSRLIPIPEGYYDSRGIFNNGYLFFWKDSLWAYPRLKVFPILPEKSQQTVKRDWSPESLCSVPNATIIGLFFDLSQNMIAIAYVVADGIYDAAYQRTYIDLGTPDGDDIPPNAAGQTLFPSMLLPRHEIRGLLPSQMCDLMSSGRHIAVQHSIDCVWWLQIWDWQHSTTSNCILSDTTNSWRTPGFCLLGSDRLLIVSDRLKLYLIEDVSQAPQLLSCFLLPISATIDVHISIHQMNNIASSWQKMQARQTIWSTDPKERLLFLSMSHPDLHFIISTRIFFFKGMATEIPWKYWGPLNTRAFQGFGSAHAVGTRILQAFTIDPTCFTEYGLRMMDFSPLAVRRGQELGRVVKEPSTIRIAIGGKRELAMTTSLPYAEVASDRKFRGGEIAEIRFDYDRIYLSQSVNRDKHWDRMRNQVEVIEI